MASLSKNEIIFYSSSIGVLFSFAYYFFKKKKKYSRLFNWINSQPVYDVQTISVMDENRIKRISFDGNKAPELSNISKYLVCISGNLNSKSYIKSTEKKIPLILKQNVHHPINSASLVHTSISYSEKTEFNPNNLELVSKYDKEYSIGVSLDIKDLKQFIKKIEQRDKKNDLDNFEKVGMFIYEGIRFLIADVFNINLRPLVIGISEFEYGIHAYTPGIIGATLCYDRTSGNKFIRSPLFVFKNYRDLAFYFIDHKVYYSLLTSVMWMGGLIMTVIFGFRIHSWAEDRLRARRARRLNVENLDLEDGDLITLESIICFRCGLESQIRSVVMLPCHHLTLCQKCFSEVIQEGSDMSKCPICRTRVQSTSKIFLC